MTIWPIRHSGCCDILDISVPVELRSSSWPEGLSVYLRASASHSLLLPSVPRQWNIFWRAEKGSRPRGFGNEDPELVSDKQRPNNLAISVADSCHQWFFLTTKAAIVNHEVVVPGDHGDHGDHHHGQEEGQQVGVFGLIDFKIEWNMDCFFNFFNTMGWEQVSMVN